MKGVGRAAYVATVVIACSQGAAPQDKVPPSSTPGPDPQSAAPTPEPVPAAAETPPSQGPPAEWDDPGPEPPPAAGPVFTPATTDRYGDPLPKGAVARLGSLAGDRDLPRLWARHYTRTTEPQDRWYEAAFRKRHDTESSLEAFKNPGRTRIAVCDSDGKSGCDLLDAKSRKWIASLSLLPDDKSGFIHEAFFAGSHFVVHVDNRTVVGVPADPAKPAKVEPDQLLVFDATDGKPMGATAIEAAQVHAGHGAVLVEAGDSVRVLPLPTLTPARALAEPKATGTIYWASAAYGAKRAAAVIEAEGLPRKRTLVTWDTDSGAVLSERDTECEWWALHPSGDEIACQPADPDAPVFRQHVEIIATADGKTRRTLPAGHRARGLQYTADGERLQGQVSVVLSEWTLDDGRAETLERGHLDQIEAIAIAGDGEYAAVTDLAGGLRVWRLRDSSTRWYRSIPQVTVDGRSLGFSPDGRTVLVASPTTCLLTTVSRLDGKPGPCLGPEFTRGGGFASMVVTNDLAAIYVDSRPWVWLVPLDGSPFRAVELPQHYVNGLGHAAGMVAQGPNHAVLHDGKLDLRGGGLTTANASGLAHLGHGRFLQQHHSLHATVQDNTGAVVHTYRLGKGWLSAMTGTEDGRVAIADEFGAIAVFDPAGKRVATFQHDEGAAVTALAFHPTEPVLISGSANATLLVWALGH